MAVNDDRKAWPARPFFYLPVTSWKQVGRLKLWVHSTMLNRILKFGKKEKNKNRF